MKNTNWERWKIAPVYSLTKITLPANTCIWLPGKQSFKSLKELAPQMIHQSPLPNKSSWTKLITSSPGTQTSLKVITQTQTLHKSPPKPSPKTCFMGTGPRLKPQVPKFQSPALYHWFPTSPSTPTLTWSTLPKETSMTAFVTQQRGANTYSPVESWNTITQACTTTPHTKPMYAVCHYCSYPPLWTQQSSPRKISTFTGIIHVRLQYPYHSWNHR